jgi:hypothetical protein
MYMYIPLSYPCSLPEEAQDARLVAVYYRGDVGSQVGARANSQQDHDEQCLEVENCRLMYI